MNLVTNKLRVVHFPQIPCTPFIVEVKDEIEAKKIMDVLSDQHYYLYDQMIIEDYSNVIEVEMWDDSPDEENNNEPYGWSNYWNEEECMEWDEFEETYLTNEEQG